MRCLRARREALVALAACVGVGVGIGIGTGCGRTGAGPFSSGSDDATTLGANTQTTGATSDDSSPSPLGQSVTASGSISNVVGTTGQPLPDPGGPDDVGTAGGTGGDDGVEPDPDDADVPYQLTPGGADLYAVSGAAGRVFAVGEAGTIANWSSESFARGPDGIDWIQIPVEANLVGVWAAPSGVVWAVSDSGVIVRGNVEGWQPELATDTQLAAIWGAAEDAIWAVGVDVIWHYDGVQWQLSETVPDAALNACLRNLGARCAGGGSRRVAFRRRHLEPARPSAWTHQPLARHLSR